MKGRVGVPRADATRGSRCEIGDCERPEKAASASQDRSGVRSLRSDAGTSATLCTIREATTPFAGVDTTGLRGRRCEAASGDRAVPRTGHRRSQDGSVLLVILSKQTHISHRSPHATWLSTIAHADRSAPCSASAILPRRHDRPRALAPPSPLCRSYFLPHSLSPIGSRTNGGRRTTTSLHRFSRSEEEAAQVPFEGGRAALRRVPTAPDA